MTKASLAIQGQFIISIEFTTNAIDKNIILFDMRTVKNTFNNSFILLLL